MKNIILLTPLAGNGGIASWGRKFIKTFNDEEFKILPIDRSVKGRNFCNNRLLSRFYAGISELKAIKSLVKEKIETNKIDLLHTTTSGGLGTFRDYAMAKLCKKYRIPTIMHCHYGCIAEDVSKGLRGYFLRRTMCLFSQIWVLDNRSLNALNKIDGFKGKVFLTPNSIQVQPNKIIAPKKYKNVAFVANLVPSKGLFELIKAVVNLNRDDLRLSIIGTGSDEVIDKAEFLAGDKFNKTIFMLGQQTNEKAVEFMKTVDILALPTYMPFEAFPISILEAMSLGKLVISTHRAAIGDMLTGLDGNPCGYFVREHSVEDITNAIKWCMDNPLEADIRCQKAYEKVYKCYRIEVVYEIYRQHYRNLLNK